MDVLAPPQPFSTGRPGIGAAIHHNSRKSRFAASNLYCSSGIGRKSRRLCAISDGNLSSDDAYGRDPSWKSSDGKGGSFRGARMNGRRHDQTFPTNVGDDSHYMRQCVELARCGLGRTSPNPMVGCVIVKDGQIVGRGFHPKAGEPHAEVFALREAGARAHGSTTYVSLEPCDHTGRTPPCSRALVAARVSRVVVGTSDPNPLVAGKGIERLRRAGVEVTVGVEEELCQQTNEAFFHRIVTKKPFTCLRYAMTVDGCLVTDPSTPVAGSFFSQQLEEYDVVVTTDASLLESDRMLVSLEPGAKQPLRVVAVTSPSLSKLAGCLTSRIFDTSLAPTLLVMDQRCLVEDATKRLGGNGDTIETVLRRKNVEVVAVNDVDLHSVLDLCYQRGACSVLLDSTAGFDMLGVRKALENEGRPVIQKVSIVVAPRVGGGESQQISSTRKLTTLTTSKHNENIIIQGYFE